MSKALSTKLKAKVIEAKTQTEKPRRTPIPISQIKNKINSYLINEYGPNCSNKYKYIYQITQNLLYNRPTHLVSIFKDEMISDFIDEFLKKFYKKKDSLKKLPQYYEFYTNYQNYFCIPTFRVNFYNKKIYQQREKKARCFYNEKFKEMDNTLTESEKNMGICAISVDGKSLRGNLYYKNKNEKIKTFFNKDVKEILEKESINYSSINNTLTLNESGSKLKSNSSYLLNTTSNEESLCDIMNGLYNKKLFEKKNKEEKNHNKINSYKNIKNILTKKNCMKNNIKIVLKKKVINFKNDNNSVNNYETSEINNTKKLSKKTGVKNLKIILNNKYEESGSIRSNRKIVKKIGLWKAINDNKENRHVKSQDNYITKKRDNLLTFHKNKISTKNISYFSINKKKPVPTSKTNISVKNQKNENVKNKIKNIFRNHKIKDFSRNSNYSKDKIGNIKKTSYRQIRLSRSNINLDIKNPNESLLNKIKNKVNNILQKKGKRKEKINLKTTQENFRKNRLFTNYSSAKRTPNGLEIYYHNFNTNKENNFLTNNHFRNNKKLDYKSNSNFFKSNKLSKSPSISEFVKFIINQKNIQSYKTNKNSQRNYQTIEQRTNNIQNLNININNQINIRLNSNINEIPNFSSNNNKYRNKFQMKLGSKNYKHKNRNKSINFNTNRNVMIKYNSSMPTFLSNNNKIKRIKVFHNNSLLETNIKSKINTNKKKFIFHKGKNISNS